MYVYYVVSIKCLCGLTDFKKLAIDKKLEKMLYSEIVVSSRKNYLKINYTLNHVKINVYNCPHYVILYVSSPWLVALILNIINFWLPPNKSKEIDIGLVTEQNAAKNK